MSLSDLQHHFQSFILAGESDISQAVTATSRVPVVTRLSIYSEAYHARLIEALESNFPQLAQLLGPEQFADLAKAYSSRHPSTHCSIRWYGDQLAPFLAVESPYDDQPVLSDLARWEWRMALAFDAADAPVLQRSALAALAPAEWAQLTFKLHPAVQRFALNTDAPAVWRALSRDEAPPEASLETSRSEATFQAWVIWRRGLDTFFRSLDAVESAGLEAIARGDSFAALCDCIAQQVGEEHAAAHAAGLLARWLEDEMLAA